MRIMRRLQFDVNFAFVLTPKSAVKSGRQTRRLFSTITNSVIKCMYASFYAIPPNIT